MLIPTVTRMIRTAWTEATPYRPFSMDWNSSALATFFPGEIRKIMAPTDVMHDVKIEIKPVAKVVLSKGRMTPKRTSSRLAPRSLAASSIFLSIPENMALADLLVSEIWRNTRFRMMMADVPRMYMGG